MNTLYIERNLTKNPIVFDQIQRIGEYAFVHLDLSASDDPADELHPFLAENIYDIVGFTSIYPGTRLESMAREAAILSFKDRTLYQKSCLRIMICAVYRKLIEDIITKDSDISCLSSQ